MQRMRTHLPRHHHGGVGQWQAQCGKRHVLRPTSSTMGSSVKVDTSTRGGPDLSAHIDTPSANTMQSWGDKFRVSQEPFKTHTKTIGAHRFRAMCIPCFWPEARHTQNTNTHAAMRRATQWHRTMPSTDMMVTTRAHASRRDGPPPPDPRQKETRQICKHTSFSDHECWTKSLPTHHSTPDAPVPVAELPSRPH